jgi:uncharacterized protein YjbI with pentapeptide repeats
MLFRLAFALVSVTALLAGSIDAVSQDMLRSVDLDGPDMSTSETTRDEVGAILKAAPQDGAGRRSAALQGKRLSHLDLSGLDFSDSNLRLALATHKIARRVDGTQSFGRRALFLRPVRSRRMY